MRIIHFTYTITGGAGTVVNKFHRLLGNYGYESAIINVTTDQPGAQVYKVHGLDKPFRKFTTLVKYWSFRLFVRLRYKKSKRHNFTYNYNYRGITLNDLVSTVPFQPDIIFLHWIADFITPSLIKQLQDKYKCPVIWRYNDLAPVSGGCHYLAGCENYKTGCGYCPALGSTSKHDWSRKHWQQKKDIFPGINLTVINSTHHTEAVFKAAPLFADKRQEFIRNSLSSLLYSPATDKLKLRREKGIDMDKKIIFWGATHITEQRKGFSFFIDALQELSKDNDWLVIIAGNKPADFNPVIAATHRFVGLVTETELADWYRMSDAVACTSVEDGGPMMIIESLMCGTPVVSFATGLALELVITGETGYLAAKSDAKDLYKGLSYVLNLQPADYALLSTRCRQKALSLYGEETEIGAYKKLFAALL